MKSQKLLFIIFAFCLLFFDFAPALADQYEAPDPSVNTPNGRILGLGRAGSALPGDTFDVFLNPAGLGQVENWAISSMSGKYLDEFSYLSFSGYYPTNLGTIGLGFMGSSIGGAFSTKKDPASSDDDPIYIIDTSQPPINYFNNLMVVSYGTNLSRFLKKFGWEKQVNLGASLKSFQAALSGDGITKGGATGMELNLGLLYDTNFPWLTLGLNLENILPATMGGKLRYETGHEESYPAAIRLGSVFRVLGKNNSIRAMGNQDLKVLVDYYMRPRLAVPATFHLGLEYCPVPIVAVRFGLDQDVIGNGLGTGVGTTGNLTSGVGFNFGGFRFDYAYNQFSWATNSSANYISLSYSPPVPEAQKNAEQVAFTSPPDKYVTFEEKLPFTGRVLDTGIASLTLAGKAPKMDLEGNFNYTAELTLGKNRLTAIGKDRSGKPNYKRDFRALRLVVFPDVKADYWVARPISYLTMLNIISGYPDGSFKPEGNISRAEMCSLLMKTKGPGAGTQSMEALATEPPNQPTTQPPSSSFKDVSAKHWAAQYIAQASALDVVKGYPGKWFKPNGKITRAEGLAMIVRFAGVTQESYEYEFPDVTYTHWSARIIAGAAKAEMLGFLDGKRFEPNQKLTRAEAVEMLYRSPYVKNILAKDLLDWDSY